MQLEHDIVSLPEKTTGYHLTAYTEVLRARFGSALFLDASGILLVELAIVLHRWLLDLEHGPKDFYYSSMDFEEEPILALRFHRDRELFVPESVWAAAEVEPVSPARAQRAASRYIAALRQELSDRLGVTLDETLDAAIKGDPSGAR